MTARILARLVSLGLLILAAYGATDGLAASLSVPRTGVALITRPITVNDLKPPQCAGITLTAMYVGTGSVTGGPGNDLILLVPPNSDAKGNAGNDCIVGGAGNDNINGGSGTGDVCIGGGGTNTFRNCEAIY